MTAPSPGTPNSSLGSIEALKRLKQVEGEAEAQVLALTAEGERLLQGLKNESADMIQAVRAEVEKGRDAILTDARAKAEREAEGILKEGRDVAAKILPRAGKELDGLREKLLDAVLAGLRKQNNGRAGA